MSVHTCIADFEAPLATGRDGMRQWKDQRPIMPKARCPRPTMGAIRGEAYLGQSIEVLLTPGRSTSVALTSHSRTCNTDPAGLLLSSARAVPRRQLTPLMLSYLAWNLTRNLLRDMCEMKRAWMTESIGPLAEITGLQVGKSVLGPTATVPLANAPSSSRDEPFPAGQVKVLDVTRTAIAPPNAARKTLDTRRPRISWRAAPLHLSVLVEAIAALGWGSGTEASAATMTLRVEAVESG